MDPSAKTIGWRIRCARVEAGLTLAELAAITKLGAPCTLANFEAGRRELRVSQLLSLARALDLSAAELLTPER